MASRAGAILDSRHSLRLLIARDLKVRYADSVLGYLWSVLDPLVMAGVYWFVFTKIFNRGVGTEPYIVFLLLGLLPWNWTNGVVTDTTRALTQEAKLVRSTNLPREVWVLRIVGAKLVEFALSIPVVALFMLVYGVGVDVYALALPVAVVTQTMLLTGAGLLLAPLTVLFNDLQRLVRIVLRILFYLSPVIYGVHDVPDQYRPLFALNPMSGILDLYRAAVFGEEFAGWAIVATSVAVSAAVLALGALVFRRLEGTVLKEI